MPQRDSVSEYMACSAMYFNLEIELSVAVLPPKSEKKTEKEMWAASKLRKLLDKQHPVMVCSIRLPPNSQCGMDYR